MRLLLAATAAVATVLVAGCGAEPQTENAAVSGVNTSADQQRVTTTKNEAAAALIRRRSGSAAR